MKSDNSPDLRENIEKLHDMTKQTEELANNIEQRIRKLIENSSQSDADHSCQAADIVWQKQKLRLNFILKAFTVFAADDTDHHLKPTVTEALQACRLAQTICQEMLEIALKANKHLTSDYQAPPAVAAKP